VAARNAFDSTSDRPIAVQPVCDTCHVSVGRKQVFESPRKIGHQNGTVINCDVLQKNIYKSFKQQPWNRFFQMLHPAMAVSDYRDKDFRVSFARVTFARCACEGAALFAI
jgi:hypothetical protein